MLTLASALLLDAQRQGEPAAWVTRSDSTVFPPDLAEIGVDLDALAIVRVPDSFAAARAADKLVRSGAFGLVVLDLGTGAAVPMALQSRLLGLVRTHDTALVCLTEKGSHVPSLSSLVSLRGKTRRTRLAEGRFSCEMYSLKDKRRGPGWTHSEVCRGPAGLR